MKPAIFLLPALIMSALVFTTADAQTKKERTVQTKGYITGMYDGTESEAAMEYYRQGHDAFQQKDLKGAVKLYKKAIEEDPKFVEAYDNLALTYRHLGDFDNAIANYKKSIELYPEGAMAHINLGLVYRIQKKYTESIKEYETVQKLEPDNAEGYFGTIQVYLTQEKYEKAIEAAKKTLEIYEATNDPFLPDGQYLLGLSYYYNKDLKNAKIYLEQAKNSGVKVPQDMLDELKIK